MQYRTLGRSGTVVSAQTLGTMTFGAEADEETSGAILTRFVETGGTQGVVPATPPGGTWAGSGR